METDIRARGPLFRVERLVPEGKPAVLTKTNIILGNLITLVQLFLFLGAIIGLVVCIGLMFHYEDWYRDPYDKRGILAAVGAAVCAVLFVVFGYATLKNAGAMANAFFRRKLDRLIMSRADARVKPSVPNAVFVEVVPRANMNKQMLETATDIGYALAAPGAREFIIEGAKCRYTAPGASIEAAAIEDAVIFTGSSTVTYHFICLRARAQDGLKELCFRPRDGTGVVGNKARRARVEKLLREIQQVMG